MSSNARAGPSPARTTRVSTKKVDTLFLFADGRVTLRAESGNPTAKVIYFFKSRKGINIFNTKKCHPF